MSALVKRVVNPVAIQNKIKGTIIEKWMFFWKGVIKDYKDVAIGLKEEAIQKPKKAAAVVSGMTFVGICAKTNPNLKSFRSKHIQCVDDLSLVSTTVANPVSVEHLKYLERCFNTDVIRHQSFGLFSIIWQDTASDQCKNYQSTCEYLNWRYINFHRQVIDVGFLGIWWVISRKMLDYDVNY